MLAIVLSLSKDGLHTPTPWFDKLTTGLVQTVPTTARLTGSRLLYTSPAAASFVRSASRSNGLIT